MCKPFPAPRCASHAKQAIARATRNHDRAALRKAEAEYAITPENTKRLRQEAKKTRTNLTTNTTATTEQTVTAQREADTAADKLDRTATRLERKYRQALNSYVEERTAFAADRTHPTPVVTELAEKNSEPRDARYAAIENLRERDNVFATFTFEQVAKMFGVPLTGRR